MKKRLDPDSQHYLRHLKLVFFLVQDVKFYLFIAKTAKITE